MSMHPRQRQMVIRRLGIGKGGQGVALKLIKTVDGEFDPTIGAIVQTTKEYNGSGVRVNYSAYTMRNFDIPYTDYQIYLSPLQLQADPDVPGDPLPPIEEMPEPEIDDVIEFMSKLVKVVEVHPFNENGFGCGWKLRVRTA